MFINTLKIFFQDEKFPSKHVEIVGKYISNSLTETFLSSLKGVASLFGINRKNKMRMVLKISLALNKKEVIGIKFPLI